VGANPMKPQSDFSEILVEEVMTDLADTFFGARVELEQMIDVFNENLRQLSKIGDTILHKAGFLNFLFADEKTAKSFYESIGVKQPELFLPGVFTEEALPEKFPFALTPKAEFKKLVLWGYEQLQKVCKEFTHGSRYNSEDGQKEKLKPSYNLLRQMSELINEEVKKVNEMSPTCVLQFARQFNTEQVEKEKKSGTECSQIGHQNLDHKMCYKVIDFEKLCIVEYPELAEPKKINAVITSFCRQKYAMNKYRFQKRLEEIKEKSRLKR
jgi:hypothetical protein